MTIEIPNYKRLSNRIEFPDEAKILRSSGALRLFDVGSDSDFAWPEFQNALDQALHTCLHKSFWPAILKACSESITSRRVKSTYAVFRSPVDGHNYTPMINRVEIRANNSAAFQITFVQAAVGTQAVVRDKSVARIFTALNLAHRFRWEIIDRYRDPQKLRAFVEQLAATRDSRKANNGSASGGGLRVIWEAISLLEIESVNRGVYDEHELPADFKKGVDKRVRTMFSLWKKQRRRLERATGDGDIDTFAQVLADLEPINVEFISLAAQRLGELVQADARPDNDQSLRGLTPAV
jgi:hypothetical protein